MKKSFWPNSKKRVVSTGSENATKEIFYRELQSSGDFIKSGDEFIYKNNEVWICETELPIGEYLLKILTTDPKYDAIDYEELFFIEVIDITKYDHTVLQEVISNSISDLNKSVTANLSFNSVG